MEWIVQFFSHIRHFYRKLSYAFGVLMPPPPFRSR